MAAKKAAKKSTKKSAKMSEQVETVKHFGGAAATEGTLTTGKVSKGKARGRDIVPKKPSGEVRVRVVGYSQFGYRGKTHRKGAEVTIDRKTYDEHKRKLEKA